MKILVYPHSMEIGGSQLNAIQIAAATQRLGHEVLIYGQPGSLVHAVKDYGLEFIQAPTPGRRPSPAVMRDLRRLIEERNIDIVHGYEWPPALEAYLAARRTSARALGTVMSMAVAPFLPWQLPIVVGTEQIAATERMTGRSSVAVIEPPVDLASDGAAPAEKDLEEFRSTWGLAKDTPTIVCVTRLATQLKLQGILSAMSAVGEIRRRQPVQLVIVGGGEAQATVIAHAHKINSSTVDGTVVLTGEVTDPRVAYASADVALGMGGSALRSMAYSKPLIVQGEGGFWKLLTPDTLGQFLWTGWYGYGELRSDGVDVLRGLLEELLHDPDRRLKLGRFARSTVETRFSLTGAAARQSNIYQELVRSQESPTATTSSNDIRALGQFALYRIRRVTERLTQNEFRDDFNSVPVARFVEPASLRTSVERQAEPAIVYFAGVSWDSVAGTDRHLVKGLVSHRPVVWVDPPTSWLRRTRGPNKLSRVTHLGPSLIRVHTVALPGVTRPGIRWISGFLTTKYALIAARQWDKRIAHIVLSSPLQPMPRNVGQVTKAYFETDDFVAGAALFGASRERLNRMRQFNVENATVVLGVTKELAQRLGGSSRPWLALPNGCDARHYASVGSMAPAPQVWLQKPLAAVIGQVNDRIDIGLLEAVAEHGANLLIVGPRLNVSSDNDRRMNDLLERSNVQWLDRQPFERLPSILAAADVGLTPYTDTPFNRASFPLKTLEYLAAGLPVVTTDLPAAHELDTDLIHIAPDREAFARETVRLLLAPVSASAAAKRQGFAASHDWTVRAHELLVFLEEVGRPLAAAGKFPTLPPTRV